MDTKRARRPATTTEVARLAGVSRATVSHILNGHDGKYSAATEAKVRDAAAKLNYTPTVARILSKGHSDIVIILLPPATLGPPLQEALESINDTARELGLNVLTWFAMGQEETPLDVLRYLRPVAVIDLADLSAQQREVIAASNVPLIPSQQWEQVQVSPDLHTLIGDAQVELLEGRRVAYAHQTDPHEWSALSLRRERAVRAACAGRKMEAPTVVELDLTLDNAAHVLSQLSADSPLGFACYNDEVATALLAGARKLGLRVPEDVAVVGVDATPLGQLLDPPLTSVAIDSTSGVESILLELRASVQGKTVTPTDTIHSIKVVEGGTTPQLKE
ncbi:LacI family DNA-binding transcriptional regulator [Populibacterium corticicola]|uniref:LacI family DNA-binding transcriptional regulator n=1 Tax=Populibacterium corticicola TaxID=1812826 RepID=A0ABW5XF73_9MICO